MRALVDWLNHNCDTKNMLFMVENNNTFSEIAILFETHKFDNVVFYSSSQNILMNIRKTCKDIERNTGIKLPEIKYGTYNFQEGIVDKLDVLVDTVFFDSNVYYKAVESIEKLAPKYLLGRIWEDDVDTFHVWETFREISQGIFLQNIKKTGKIDAIVWTAEKYDKELSVVFPVYKVAQYLDKCIETVTAWKAPYIEFLFVNDGSPDNSVEVIQKYQKNDDRIKIINKENGGCASARKLGMEKAVGRYIGFFDPDDFIDPTMYKKLLVAAMSGNYDISYCGFNKYYENSQQVEKVSDALQWPYINGVTGEEDIHNLIIFARVAIWRGIYRREFLEKNKLSFYTDLRRFDDLPFKVETFAKAKSVIAIPEYLYYYRLERPGQDVACDDDRLYVHFDIFRHLDEFFAKKQDQKLIDLLQIVKVQTHFYAYEKIQKKFRREYAKRMRKDIKANAGFWRTYILLRKYTGKEFLFAYTTVMLHMTWLYRMNIAKKARKSRGYVKINSNRMEKLAKLYK